MALSGLKSFFKTWSDKYQTLHLEYPVRMKPRHGHGLPPHGLLFTLIDQHREVYFDYLQKALGYKEHLVEIKDSKSQSNQILPSWNNGFLPGLDMVMLYTFLASGHPSTYIEIGSGNSTKVAAKAKADHQLKTRFISIDPAPRAEIDQLVDKVVRTPFEEADLSIFKTLQAGDIVFVDNSHRIFPNSDATVFFMEVLPFLPKGVIVHIHDIYLPEDYPLEVCQRFYSEQYALAPFIMTDPARYFTLMPCWFVSRDPVLSKVLDPLWQAPSMPAVERHGASYWLEIR
jgi:hypothetical protein